MTYENITLERRDGVATLTLNRASAANSIDIPLARELMDAAIACDEDPATRAVKVRLAVDNHQLGSGT